MELGYIQYIAVGSDEGDGGSHSCDRDDGRECSESMPCWRDFNSRNDLAEEPLAVNMGR
jgi:hypothetical protein